MCSHLGSVLSYCKLFRSWRSKARIWIGMHHVYTYEHLVTCAVHTYLGSEWVAGGSDQAILRTVG
jgi:hypothetical protein